MEFGRNFVVLRVEFIVLRVELYSISFDWEWDKEKMRNYYHQYISGNSIFIINNTFIKRIYHYISFNG